ncbi:uncharacterized protein LOC128929323 [Callithrix jacchus]
MVEPRPELGNAINQSVFSYRRGYYSLGLPTEGRSRTSRGSPREAASLTFEGPEDSGRWPEAVPEDRSSCSCRAVDAARLDLAAPGWQPNPQRLCSGRECSAGTCSSGARAGDLDHLGRLFPPEGNVAVLPALVSGREGMYSEIFFKWKRKQRTQFSKYLEPSKMSVVIYKISRQFKEEWKMF